MEQSNDTAFWNHAFDTLKKHYRVGLIKSPQEVVLERYGKWLNPRTTKSGEITLVTCSECNYTTRHKTPYCPMCGAKME